MQRAQCSTAAATSILAPKLPAHLPGGSGWPATPERSARKSSGTTASTAPAFTISSTSSSAVKGGGLDDARCQGKPAACSWAAHAWRRMLQPNAPVLQNSARACAVLRSCARSSLSTGASVKRVMPSTSVLTCAEEEGGLSGWPGPRPGPIPPARFAPQPPGSSLPAAPAFSLFLSSRGCLVCS